MKITRKVIDEVFEEWMELMGYTEDDVWLDFSSIYGGYIIRSKSGGGWTNDWVSHRMPGRELYHSLSFACMSLRKVR